MRIAAELKVDHRILGGGQRLLVGNVSQSNGVPTFGIATGRNASAS